ncbi:MAG TPA: DnaJ domain-containing protein [Blastocatellia bacterium]|nr:DnaJ domain-containing protein [Blastocatellia bacterium]
MNGDLGEKLIADLVRDIAQKNSSGLLRLTHAKSIKAIFFDAGVPVFAISNQANEQLEVRIVNAKLATAGQIEEAKQAAGKASRLGQALVEMGAIDAATIRDLTRQLAIDIILSVFEWTQGEYNFDERVRAVHDVKLDWTAANCILEGIRHGASLEHVAALIAPEDVMLKRGDGMSKISTTAVLSPSESYILSRIETPVHLAEVSSLTGLPESEVRRAACALLSVGLLKVDGNDESANADQAQADDSITELSADIARKTHFFANADYYEILGVTKRSPSAEIKAAYYAMAKKYHPDRFRQAEYAELRAKLEALFSKVTQAYETLSDAGRRARYDDQLRKSPTQPASEPVRQPAITERLAALAVDQKPVSQRPPTGPLASDPPASASTSQPAPAPEELKRVPPSEAVQVPMGAAAQPSTPGFSPSQTAEHYYKQGRARIEQKDYYGAVQLFRESVKLDPGKPVFHFHLGMALMRNPRTRREGEQHLVRAAELDPFNAQIRLKLGAFYKEAGLPKKADHYFKEALNLDPANKFAQKGLAGSEAPADDSIWKSDLGSIAKRLFKK